MEKTVRLLGLISLSYLSLDDHVLLARLLKESCSYFFSIKVAGEYDGTIVPHDRIYLQYPPTGAWRRNVFVHP